MDTYYIGLVVLVIIMIALLVHAYRVWEEIHDVEDPDSPSDLLDSFEQAHAEGELDARELARVRTLLTDGNASGGTRFAAPGSPTSTAKTIETPRSVGDRPPGDTTEDDWRDGAS